MPTMDPQVEQLIRRHQLSAPVDVLGLAEALHVNVWEDDLGNRISGKLFSDDINGGMSGYSIVINEHEPDVRKRFTIAHEIAHFVLHRKEIACQVEDDVFYRSALSNAQEAEANRFAAELLMPLPLLARLQEDGFNDIAEMAQQLQVSQQALKIRLEIPVVD